MPPLAVGCTRPCIAGSCLHVSVSSLALASDDTVVSPEAPVGLGIPGVDLIAQLLTATPEDGPSSLSVAGFDDAAVWRAGPVFRTGATEAQGRPDRPPSISR